MLKPFTRYVCIISFKLYKRFEEGDLLQPGCTPQSTGGTSRNAMFRPNCRRIKPESLGVGRARAFLALPSGKSNVHLNLRSTYSKYNSYPPVESKGDKDSGKASDCCYEERPETQSQTPNWGAFISWLRSSYCVPATERPYYSTA